MYWEIWTTEQNLLQLIPPILNEVHVWTKSMCENDVSWSLNHSCIFILDYAYAIREEKNPLIE